MNNYAALANRSLTGGLATHTIFDDTRNRYMVFETGWWEKKRVRSVTLYICLLDSKLWSEEDWPEEGRAGDLLTAGVPKEDIVLAFHHPDRRPFTEFATA